MHLKTFEWATGLRDNLQAAIDRMADDGLRDTLSVDRVLRLRRELRQVENLVALLLLENIDGAAAVPAVKSGPNGVAR